MAKRRCALTQIQRSLDLETVLREIVDSARALTGTRHGVITSVDDAGQPQDFVTAGLASGVHAVMAAWSDGPRLFAQFRTGPNRCAWRTCRPTSAGSASRRS